MEFPHSPNDPDKDSLPDPKLNPLLNPLLAAHMGRWAEVYFTSPPEKRDEAVAELLRELAREEQSSPAEYAAQAAAAETARPVAPEPHIATMEPSHNEYSAEPEARKLVCRECGHYNATSQRYCGMCGSSLQGASEPEPIHTPQQPEVVKTMSFLGTTWEEHQSQETPQIESFEHDNDGADDGPMLPPAHEYPEPAWRPGIPSFASEADTEPVSYRSRLLIGAALVVVLGALAYMGWRGKAPNSSGLQTDLQSVPSRNIPDAPSATAPAQENAGDTKSASENPAPAAGRPEAPAPPVARPREIAKATPPASRRAVSAKPRPSPRMVPVTANSPAPRVSQSYGAEEYNMGERYLRGGPGTARDSREAATWLWKAVQKENPAAAVALSDLYLHGDGVAKNCDQARILLDAAARKGAPGAGERLRNLQAFGCK